MHTQQMHLLYTLHWPCSWPSLTSQVPGVYQKRLWVGTIAKGETEAYSPRNAIEYAGPGPEAPGDLWPLAIFFPALLPLSVSGLETPGRLGSRELG